MNLPETNVVPDNGWLEDEISFLGSPIFRCYVSFWGGYISFLIHLHPKLLTELVFQSQVQNCPIVLAMYA